MPEPKFGEEEARELWRRAVELQMQAERESGHERALAPGTGEGLSLEQVSEAAESAGIGRDYLMLALAEQRLPEGREIDRQRWITRWLRRLVSEVDVLEASRLIPRDAEQLLEAFRRVAATAPFEMVHEESFGEDPLGDGVLVYRLGGSWASAGSFHSELELADARVLLVTIRPEGDGARIRVRAPLFHRGLNLALAGGFTGGLGAGGSYGGAAAGGAIAGLLGTTSLALVAGPAVLGALVGGAVGLAGFRRVYRWAGRKGDTALQRLVKAVELEAQAE